MLLSVINLKKVTLARLNVYFDRPNKENEKNERVLGN
jgi:hypothetical protein